MIRTPIITAVIGLSFILSSAVQAQVPSNDECVNATIIPSDTTLPYVSPLVDAQFATNNANDSVAICSDFVAANWLSTYYEWEPNATGIYLFYNVDRTQSILIELFRGSDCGSLFQIGCDYGIFPLFEARLTANEKYYIKVSTDPVDSKPVRLFVDAAIPPPPNAVCSGAAIVEGGDMVFGGLNFSVFDIPSFFIDCYRFHILNEKNPTLWYKVTNTMASPIGIIASTCNPSTAADTVITVFEGNDGCTALKCVGGADDPAFIFDRVDVCGSDLAKFGFIAAPSTTYYIAVELLFFFGEFLNFTMSIESATNYFDLIDASSDESIGLVQDDMDYFRIVSSNLNIEAVFDDSIDVQSVMVLYDDDPAYTRCERKPPFSIFKDRNGNFFDGTISVGEHNITANAYTQPGCTGEIASTLAQRFYMDQCFYFILVSKVSQNTTIAEASFFESIFVDSLPCNDVNIEAIFNCGFDTEEVVLTLRNATDSLVLQSRTERFTPYYLYGNKGAVVNRGTINAGEYFLEVIINGITLFPTEIFVTNDCTST